MTDADKVMHPQHFGTEPTEQTSGSGSALIRQSGMESRVTFGRNFAIGRGLHSLSALVLITIK